MTPSLLVLRIDVEQVEVSPDRLGEPALARHLLGVEQAEAEPGDVVVVTVVVVDDGFAAGRAQATQGDAEADTAKQQLLDVVRNFESL